MAALKERPQPKSQPAWLVAAVLFAVTLLVFARGGANGFVNYDDPDYVTANEQVQAGLTRSGLVWALTANVASNWHPLTWLSHMLDVSLWHRNPHGHHATSIVLHALNAVLAFLALRRLTGALWTPALAAALFAWHPLRVESVAWVAERKDVLSGLLFFAVLWAYAGYVQARQRKRRAGRWYAGVLVLFGLGLMAKPMVVTIPCVLLLLDYWPLRRASTDSRSSEGDLSSPAWLVAEKVPLFVLAAGSSAVTYFVQKASGAVTTALTFPERVANAFVGLARYMGKVVWPIDLAVLYPHPGDWPRVAVIASFLLVTGVTIVAILLRRRWPWVLVGWLWFVGMLVPVIGLVQVGLQSIADRYTYLPVIGLELAALWTAREVWGAAFRRQGVAAVGLALGALAVLTVAQLRVWRNSITLFTHTLAVAGDGNYLAYDNRGIALSEAGEVELAMADFRHALAINPDYPNAHNNLGRILANRGQLPEAIEHYRQALRVAPDMLEVHNNLANALSDAGAVDEAITQYQFVLRRKPKHLNARNGYAVALAMKGLLPQAENELRGVLRDDPDNVSALSNLGNVCAMLGRRTEAKANFERALELQPDDARTWYNLGNVLTELGLLGGAANDFRRAIGLAPLNPDAHAALGTALLRLGRRKEGMAELETALQQRPDFPQARAWLENARRMPPGR